MGDLLSGRQTPEKAFIDRLYEAHGTVLLAVILPTVDGDLQAAEDIVQETMLKAWQHAGTVGELNSPRPWLFTVARRIAIDRWRSRKARPHEVADTALQFVGVPDHAETSLSGILVREALAKLAPKHRAVLVEVFLHGRSGKEAAAVLGIPIGTLKSRVHNALRLLRAALDEREADEDD